MAVNKGFADKVAGDIIQYSMEPVKSHFPEADLEPVGDEIALDSSDEDWEAHRSSVKPIAERIVADLGL